MSLFDFVAVLLVLAAAFSYLNHRLLRLPTTIGLMVLTLLASLAAVAAGLVFPAFERQAAAFVRQIDFDQAVLQGMLGFLLFAGALHIDLGDLARQKWTITVLATVGVVLTTLIPRLSTGFTSSSSSPTPGVGDALLQPGPACAHQRSIARLTHAVPRAEIPSWHACTRKRTRTTP